MPHVVRVSLIVALVLIALTVPARIAPPAWAQELDPASLLGEWSGRWNAMSAPGLVQKYYLTIKKVEGKRVEGHVEREGPRLPPNVREFDFVGLLNGNVLTFAPPGLAKTEITFIGKTANGTINVGDRVVIQLTKN
jgi:hypothetical protein